MTFRICEIMALSWSATQPTLRTILGPQIWGPPRIILRQRIILGPQMALGPWNIPGPRIIPGPQMALGPRMLPGWKAEIGVKVSCVSGCYDNVAGTEDYQHEIRADGYSTDLTRNRANRESCDSIPNDRESDHPDQFCRNNRESGNDDVSDWSRTWSPQWSGFFSRQWARKWWWCSRPWSDWSRECWRYSRLWSQRAKKRALRNGRIFKPIGTVMVQRQGTVAEETSWVVMATRVASGKRRGGGRGKQWGGVDENEEWE